MILMRNKYLPTPPPPTHKKNESYATKNIPIELYSLLLWTNNIWLSSVNLTVKAYHNDQKWKMFLIPCHLVSLCRVYSYNLLLYGPTCSATNILNSSFCSCMRGTRLRNKMAKWTSLSLNGTTIATLEYENKMAWEFMFHSSKKLPYRFTVTDHQNQLYILRLMDTNYKSLNAFVVKLDVSRVCGSRILSWVSGWWLW